MLEEGLVEDFGRTVGELDDDRATVARMRNPAPGWLQAIADVNPITVVVDGLRALALGGDLGPVSLALVWTAGITAVAAPLAVAAYRRIR